MASCAYDFDICSVFRELVPGTNGRSILSRVEGAGRFPTRHSGLDPESILSNVMDPESSSG